IELELQNEELRGARLEVEALLARYTELFDFAPIGYALLDAAGLIVELNHSGARILGTYRSAVAGKPFARAGATADLPTPQALLESAVEGASPNVRELRMAEAPRALRVHATAVGSARSAILIAFDDITEAKANAERLVRSEQALREADRRRNEFLAV